MRFGDLLGQAYAPLTANGALPAGAVEEQIEDRLYVNFAREGVILTIDDDDGLIHSVQFYGDPPAGMARFAGALPAGLNFDMSRSVARSLLGAPARSGEVKDLPILGRMPAWDKWATPVPVHAEYAFGEASIRLVTVEI
jgi:hypothetical protein